MMKNRIRKPLVLMILFTLAVSLYLTAAPDSKGTGSEKHNSRGKTKLFNGKDLDNWVFFLRDNTVDPSTVFQVKNGVIHITGEPFGYMRTKATYSDYRLHVEWRWPVEPSNSGVFVHGQLPDAIWLKCIECQLMAGNAGDFVCMNGADMKERADKKNAIVKKLGPSSEKKPGKWNTMEIVCDGNTIEVWVNGVLQNRGTEVSVNAGSICLQSEGKDIEFRNIYIQPLKKK